ncbi:hypothetical protein K504DRAFT_461836 [Pleomassaria siparia CBS 279.74]|uniref:Uncharacterized protein n=1 Tax=Pleomassaria siparia CBS 279.74 TaxID=1314801 RepID=A0A6G1KKC3_9PLEO|nr:hypothetical protein K504DRAFT_461836 [Pleomassaria siparia CBS 279.74]
MKRQESALFPSRQIAGRIPMYQTQSYDDYSNGGGDGNVRVDVDMDMDVNMDDRETNADEGGPSSSPCARKRASADALEGTANKKMRPDPKRRGYEHEIVVIDDDDNDEDQVPILGEVVGRFVVIEDDDDDDDDDNEEKKKEKKKKKKEDDIEKQLPHR